MTKGRFILAIQYLIKFSTAPSNAEVSKEDLDGTYIRHKMRMCEALEATEAKMPVYNTDGSK